MLSIPHQGFYLRNTSKLAKLSLYSSTYDSVSSTYLIATRDERNNRKLIAKVPVNLQKAKRIATFKKELADFCFFTFSRVTNKI